jgi:hypothetical protein
METITAKDYAGILLIVPQNIMDFAYVNFCLSFFFFFVFFYVCLLLVVLRFEFRASLNHASKPFGFIFQRQSHTFAQGWAQTVTLLPPTPSQVELQVCTTTWLDF